MTAVPDRLTAALADRYRLERELGQGGMATVYLAEDLKHDRKVALKILRPELSAILGAERFLAEIKTTANLQHPHILPLFDSGRMGGQVDGGDEFLYYVMPYIPGESLRQRLHREGEMPVRDAVRLLIEVADALAYAHGQGVVHRDIKPENILLAGRHAMVADFGVAKAVSQAASGERLTSTGISIGTPAYMAPEQAAADPNVDHRADIYALGVLGYEILAGWPPFRGLTAQQLLAAHATRAPEAVSVERPSIPPGLDRAIMRCLEKRPADRYQTAEELVADLEAVQTPEGSVAGPAISGPGTPSVQRGLQRFALPGVAILALGAIWFVLLGRGPRQPAGLTTANAVAVTTEPGTEFQPALSPDGSLVAYAVLRFGREQIAVRSARIASGAEVRPAESDSGYQALPAWSPDGEFLRYASAPGGRDGKMAWREVGQLGGPTRALVVPRTARWTAWSPDGASVAVIDDDTLFIFRPGDTTAVPFPATLGPNSVTWSPDGRRVAYVLGNPQWPLGPNTASSSIWIATATGGPPVEVAGADFLNVSPAWLDPGHLLFVSNRDGPREVYVIEVGDRGAVGEPRKVPGGTDAHSISVGAGGTRLAIAKLSYRQNVWFYPVNSPRPVPARGGRQVTTGTQSVESHALSRDGRWLAYSSNLRGTADIFKIPIDGGTPIPVTTAPTDEFAPAWSPDGQELAYEISGDLWLVSSDGGKPLQLTSGPEVDLHPAWAPNGLGLAFTSNRSPWTIWLLGRERVGGPWAGPRQLSSESCFFPQWVPDGSGVWCNERDRMLLLITLDGVVRRRVGLAAQGIVGTQPVLSPDGATLYSVVTAEEGRGVWSWPVRGGAPRLLMRFDDPGLEPLGGPGSLTVGPDGLYLTLVEQESDIWVMDLVRGSAP